MNRLQNTASKSVLLFVSAWLCAVSVTGCTLYRGRPIATVSAYKPSNVFRAGPFIPSHIRRVAVLPISAAPEDWQASEGRCPLEPVLKSELGKIKAFEQVVVTREQLKIWTGQESWRPEDELPANFFKKIEEGTGCNAVFFTMFHPFHAYRPVVMGWEMKLVEVGKMAWRWGGRRGFWRRAAGICSRGRGVFSRARRDGGGPGIGAFGCA